MKKTKILNITILAAALLPIPVFAATTIGLEVTNYQATGQDTVLGSEFDTAPFDNQVLEYDAEANFTLMAAHNNLRFSFLNYVAKTSEGDPNSLNYQFALDHPDSDYGGYTNMDADGKLELQIVDLGYATPINNSLSYTLGARYVNYTNSVDANVDNGGSIVAVSAKSSLFGFRFGLDQNFSYGAGFGLEVGAALSLLMGTNEYKHTDTGNNFERKLKSDTVVPGFEAGIKGTWSYLKNGKVWLGYDIIRFQRLASNQIFVDDVNEATQVQDGIDAGFHGFKLGTSWTF